MIGKIITHYKIIEKLGTGGMGVVYKAQDLKLDRFVALKFLSPLLAANDEEKKRFIYEAKAASALDHPNICTIHEIDETEEGQMFIAMAYYDGETLKKSATSNQLSVSSIVDIAIQIARGLAKAHEQGIAHRDLKPENVIITKEGVVKIVDFGLAKLSGRTRLTKDGTTKGTAAYMSPEQARGEDTDQRTDIWSLGVVMYEMLAGRLPFAGEKEPAVIYGILTKNPKPVSTWRIEVPEILEHVINRALAKDAEKRYQRAEEMLEELRLLKQQLKNGHTGEYQISSRRATNKKRGLYYSGIAMALILLSALSLNYFLPQRKDIESVAILPFVNVGNDPETEYLSDGISESLIRNLSQLPRLKVISFSVASRYKEKNRSVQEIARELEVQTVLFGRVLLRGETLSISTELVNADDNRHIWGEQYDRKLAELLVLQDEMTAALTGKLQPDLSGAEKQRMNKHYTRNAEAHQFYLKGRYYTAKYTKESFKKGLQYLRKALEKDPNYALAYAGLANYYVSSFEWMMSPREALPKAKEAAHKALVLDETLAEAHASLGAVYFYHDWDGAAAEREFKRAIELNPNYATTYLHYAPYLMANGRLQEALALAKRAFEIEPLSLESNTYLGWISSVAGQSDLARAHLNSALEMDPNFWFAHIMLGLMNESGNRLDEACAEYKQASVLEGEFSEALANLGRCYARQGEIEAAKEILLELKRRNEKNYVPPYFFFMIHYALGEKDEALLWFQAAFEQRCVYLLWDKVFMYSNYKREDPRLTAILDKVGVKNVE